VVEAIDLITNNESSTIENINVVGKVEEILGHYNCYKLKGYNESDVIVMTGVTWRRIPLRNSEVIVNGTLKRNVDNSHKLEVNSIERFDTTKHIKTLQDCYKYYNYIEKPFNVSITGTVIDTDRGDWLMDSEGFEMVYLDINVPFNAYNETITVFGTFKYDYLTEYVIDVERIEFDQFNQSVETDEMIKNTFKQKSEQELECERVEKSLEDFLKNKELTLPTDLYNLIVKFVQTNYFDYTKATLIEKIESILSFYFEELYYSDISDVNVLLTENTTSNELEIVINVTANGQKYKQTLVLTFEVTVK
jgi:DNA-binding protein Fis